LPNYILRLSFVGTKYHGWQFQPQKPTLQGTLAQALERVLNSPVKLVGCCRTDAGVHALDYIANCITEKHMDCYKLLRGVNSLLPPDISLLDIKEAPAEFNARYGVKSKVYLYRVWNSPVRNPFMYPFSWHVPVSLNRDLMRETLELLEGEHDFSGFAKLDEDGRRTIINLHTNMEYREELIEIRLRATHFLRYMVRRVVGTLIWVAEGKLTLRDVQEFLQGKKAPYTAPPQGLHLERVELSTNHFNHSTL
jgi:tRNA pseudouridine38-40 synthase